MDAAGNDHPGIVAFPPLLWLINAIVSVQFRIPNSEFPIPQSLCLVPTASRSILH